MYGETPSTMWWFSASIFVLSVGLGHCNYFEGRTLLPSTNPTLGYIRKKDQACAGGLFNISDHGHTSLATCAHLCTASGSCGAFVHVPGDSDNSCRLKRSCPTPANFTGADLYFKRLCSATAANRTETVFTIVCPPGCASVAGPIFGDGIYSSNSSVCKAAVHHGWIMDELGGAVTVRKFILARLAKPITHHGVSALEYDGTGETSFHFAHGCGSVMTLASRTQWFYSNSPFDEDSECNLHIIDKPCGMIALKYGFNLAGGAELQYHAGPKKRYFVSKFTNTAVDWRQSGLVPDVHEAYFDLFTGSQVDGQHLRVKWGTFGVKRMLSSSFSLSHSKLCPYKLFKSTFN
ncbi:uncharacterized protein LOC144902161 [Branchiostoma floridae x Branchiostoma belcheri]